MLKEDQVIDLLFRCEKLLGERLTQARGNLKHPESRSAAIWELIGIEEFARHIPITHEPEGKSRPDLLLNHNGCETAVELTFLYPRFWENDRKRDQAQVLIREALQKESISLRHIRTYFEGEKSSNGYFQTLPELHEKDKIRKHVKLSEFIESIKKHPNLDFYVKLEPFDIDLFFEPSKPPWNFSSGNIVEGHCSEPSQSAVYRKIREKHRKHKLEIPHFVCIGGDDSSPIASVFGDGTIERRAVVEAFKKYPKVSGLSLSQLEWSPNPYNMKPEMQSKVFINDHARYPLNSDFKTMLESINFNRWRYTFSLPKWDRNPMDKRLDLVEAFE